jgi:general secretion pathway protein L
MKVGLDNWRQRLRDAANRVGLPRFWRWWIGELAPLLPSASRIAFQRRFVRPVIEFADGEAVFWRPEFGVGPTRLVIVEKVSLTGDAAAVLAAGRAAVARLAADASGGLAAPKVVIALSSRQVLRKELTLPAAVEENLAQTLAYDLDRHTPFRPEQLYFDAVVVSRDAAKKTLRVDWAAALRSIVDDARKQVEAWGAVPRAVVPGPPATAAKLNLIPDIARPRPLEWRRWQVWAPAAIVATIALAAVIVPLAQKRQYAIALNALSAEAGQQAQAADAVRQQLEVLQNDYNYVLAKKYAYPSLVHVLDEVTRTLPDDTWLTQFELKTGGRGKELQRDLYLRGESGNAGKLIALLEDTKLVEQAAPRSPTTKIQGASGEIFDVGARLRTLTLPAPETLTLGAVPVASPPVVPAQSAAAPAPAPAPAAPAPTAPAVAAAPAAAPQPVAGAPAPLVPMRAAPSQTISPTTAAGFGPFPEGYVPPPSTVLQDAAPRPARQGRHALPPAAPGAAPAAPPAAAPMAAPAAGAPTAPPPAADAPPPSPGAAEPDEDN